MNRYYRIWRITSMFISFFIKVWWYKKREERLGKRVMAPRWTALFQDMAHRFCETAVELGGLLIKAGQFFATRVDLLPSEITKELSQLQDAVPAASFDHVQKTIQKELGKPLEEVFLSFNKEPIAAASLGQVHQAVLPKGDKVAVKILRPKIDQIINADFAAIRITMIMAKFFTDLSKQLDLDAIYQEMHQTFSDELDYRLEIKNAERFRNNLAEFENIYIPRMYKSHSTSKVLTMEFIEGQKIDNYEFLKKHNIDREELGRRLIQSYLHQVVVDGFFHADPHQGNLYVKADGTLVFLDFGMVGEISNRTKENLRNLLFSVVERDSEKMVDAMANLGFLRPTANRNLVRKAMQFFLDNHTPEQMKEMEKTKNLGPIGADLREFIYDQPMQIPANLIFMGRAGITAFGVAFGLDSTMGAEVAGPYIKKLMEDKDGGLTNVVLQRVKDYGTTLITLPGLLSRTLKKADLGELYVKVGNLGDIQRAVLFQTRLANRLVLALLTSTATLCAVIFYTQDFYSEARGAALIAAFLGILLLWHSRKKPRDSSQPFHRNGPF
ncbi:AarF/ABC1/UbiB kinase family protein [Heliorestis acidaminivorans]|uniref:AarF/ABC1/UbiB kinase family protein n=1 Tax=Heliorestis acidaminivorans TaxID=553427 RepID=A0A6I0F009_9FIRM|nr:AarF/UbiB family protein [Heliorestis acidaminivorans]KAB2953075.1 AarF/ABC1/UbiB kinase family protein [Heliorestis acidaminivorans]